MPSESVVFGFSTRCGFESNRSAVESASLSLASDSIICLCAHAERRPLLREGYSSPMFMKYKCFSISMRCASTLIVLEDSRLSQSRSMIGRVDDLTNIMFEFQWTFVWVEITILGG